jgi:hypothetical protein
MAVIDIGKGCGVALGRGVDEAPNVFVGVEAGTSVRVGETTLTRGWGNGKESGEVPV